MLLPLCFFSFFPRYIHGRLSLLSHFSSHLHCWCLCLLHSGRSTVETKLEMPVRSLLYSFFFFFSRMIRPSISRRYLHCCPRLHFCRVYLFAHPYVVPILHPYTSLIPRSLVPFFLFFFLVWLCLCGYPVYCYPVTRYPNWLCRIPLNIFGLVQSFNAEGGSMA